MKSIGNEIYTLANRLFPINRSLTGDGVRETLKILQEYNSELNIFEIPTGTKVFDWTVPKEWNVAEAYIENESGIRIIEYAKNNLCLLGYSTPIDMWVTCEELKQYIYVEENQPNAIPYVTSYYKERFGFCMAKIQRDALQPGKYHMVIKSRLEDGFLTYGEILVQGETKKEILLSTYICHPSMANNELSGICVATYLAKWIQSLEKTKYSYRILFLPETIGSITYLSKHLEEMKKYTIAGFVISCVGDNRTYSYVSSRKENTLADRVAKNVLSYHYPEYKKYSFLNRGSDERQYNSVGVDLPVCVVCRSKFGEFPEYHTSLDNMDFISPDGLEGAFEVLKKMLQVIEYNEKYRTICCCEPQLGKRGLYPTISKKGTYNEVKSMVDFIAYADGENDLIDISNKINVPTDELIEIIKKLEENRLIERV